MKGAASVLLVGLLALASCAEEQRATGPPRCEPPNELIIERGLKAGFRALLDEDLASAEGRFEEVLELTPGHPEARAGLRMTEENRQSSRRRSRRGAIVAGGHDLPTRRAVDHDTLRLETRAAEAAAARRLAVAVTDEEVVYEPRNTDPQGALAGVDLVVLHASESQTALERFVRQASGGASAHFLIDWDGAIYQTLDLASIARHTGSAPLDARSIAIELVTPLTQDAPPLPSQASGVERPMSQRLRVQGKLLRAWGYTAAQMVSLTSLLLDLTGTLPDLDARLPGEADGPSLDALSGDERAKVRGIVGALHVDPRSLDPGPGFDWQALREGLR